ncbi:MAG: SIR2 family protein [Chloroflexota bacterium]
MDAGLPSSVGLTSALIEELEREGDLQLKRALGLILGGMAFRRGAEGFLGVEHQDVEAVLRVADMLESRAANGLAGYVASWNASLESLAPGGDGLIFRRLIDRSRDVLRDMLQTPADGENVKYLTGIRRVTQPWSRGGKHILPPVFTLNYDRCLEKALNDENSPYTVGFRDGLWTPDVFEQTNLVRVYKLHGSFGWFRNPQTSLLYDRDQALQREELVFESGDTEDELIFATENKLRAVQPFLWLVHQFSEAVGRAAYVVTIGYGYNDEYINQIISHAMATAPQKHLVVVSPRCDHTKLEHAKGMSHFQPERTKLIQKGAKAALEENAIGATLTELEQARSEGTPF